MAGLRGGEAPSSCLISGVGCPGTSPTARFAGLAPGGARLTLERLGGRLPAASIRLAGMAEKRGKESMAWHPVLEEGKLGEGEIAQGEAAGESLALYKVGDKVYATQELCTHAYVSLVDGYLEGTIIECPVHQARFDITTGKVLDPPANSDLKTYKVKIENGMICVEV
jgi:nitrite reductase/ring-hydroxylating ferredoxin subunit